MAHWYVFRKPKGRKNGGVQSMGKYDSEEEARAAMKESRENDQYKVYSWSIGRA